MNNTELKRSIKTILPWLQKLIWVIPGLLIPISFVIYYSESKNLLQLISIVGFAIVLFIILKGMLKFADKQLDKL